MQALVSLKTAAARWRAKTGKTPFEERKKKQLYRCGGRRVPQTGNPENIVGLEWEYVCF